jgi:hypothetical protein
VALLLAHPAERAGLLLELMAPMGLRALAQLKVAVAVVVVLMALWPSDFQSLPVRAVRVASVVRADWTHPVHAVAVAAALAAGVR